MARIRQARVVDGRSHQEIAHERNEAGMPTFSGQGTWQKGTAERFYQRKPNYRPVVEQ